MTLVYFAIQEGLEYVSICIFVLWFMQAKHKNCSGLATGMIIGVAPLTVAILSPVFGYLVRKVRRLRVATSRSRLCSLLHTYTHGRVQKSIQVARNDHDRDLDSLYKYMYTCQKNVMTSSQLTNVWFVHYAASRAQNFFITTYWITLNWSIIHCTWVRRYHVMRDLCWFTCLIVTLWT